jgi:hypothetical protein
MRSMFCNSTSHAASKPARAAVATAAAAAAARAILSLIDLERTALEVCAVQSLHGAGRIGVRHLDETETAGPTGVAIGDQRYFLDGAMRREEGANRFFSCSERQIADVELGHFRVLAVVDGNIRRRRAARGF